MKKISIIIITIISILVLTSCKTIYGEDIKVNRTKEIDFISLSSEYNIVNSKVELFYYANDLNPYIDIKDYINMLDGVYYANEFEFTLNNNVLTINYFVEFSSTEIRTFTINIDFDLDTIEVLDLEFFDYYIKRSSTNYSEGLINLPSLIQKGNEVVYEVGKYGFDLELKEDSLLFPLSIINLIFNQAIYFDTYYNGDVIYGIDTSDLNKGSLGTILTSSYNNTKAHDSITSATYNFLEFSIDYFYGLFNDRNFTSAKDFLKPHERKLKSKDFSKEVFNVVNSLDDLHSSHLTRGYYNNKRLNNSYLSLSNGPNISKFYDGMDKVKKEASNYFGVSGGVIEIPSYELIENNSVAIIYLLEFNLSTPKEVENVLKKIPNTVEDIVIDLSFNTGGNLGSVLRVFALMTNNDIGYHILNPLDQSKSSYFVKGDKPAYTNYNYYVKTSSVTFSAANLMASISKELKIPVIGQSSSGGASSISFYVLPDGSIIILSSNMILTNNKYESIEFGITPDYILNSLYNNSEIINAIKSYKQ